MTKVCQLANEYELSQQDILNVFVTYILTVLKNAGCDKGNMLMSFFNAIESYEKKVTIKKIDEPII